MEISGKAVPDEICILCFFRSVCSAVWTTYNNFKTLSFDNICNLKHYTTGTAGIARIYFKNTLIQNRASFMFF